jgi:hypothetical protein
MSVELTRRVWGPLTLTLTFAAAPAAAQVYDPSVILSTSLTNVAQAATVNLLDLGTSARAGLVTRAPVSFDNGAGTITFAGTAGIYSGSVAGVTAAPYIGIGQTTQNYFTAQPSGGVTISYASSQRYFGMAWGSVDSYNTLTFYNGNQIVQQLPGRAITNNASGSQGVNGTYYVNLNFTGATSFDRVVATSTTPAFEFGVVAFSSQTQAITQAQQQQAQAAGQAAAPRAVQVSPAPLAASPLLALLVGWWRQRRSGTQ